MFFKNFLVKNKQQMFSNLALMSNPSIVIALDKNLMIHLFNPAAEKYFNLNAAIFLGRYYTVLSKYLELDQLTYILRQKAEYALLIKNILTKVIHPFRSSKNLVWSLQKILDQRKSCLGFLLTGEETECFTLKEERKLFDLSLTDLINKIPGSVYFKDLNGKYLWVNDFVVKMAGKESVLDIVGKNDYEFCWEEIADEWRRNDMEVIKNKLPKITEESVILADGKRLSFLANKTPIFDEGGQVIGIMGTSLDISDYKKLEHTLKKAREDAEAANRAKIQFIADMSHDLKIPLVTIILLSKLLTDNMEKKYRDLTEETMISGKNLLTFFENCIELSKLENNSFVSPEVSFNLEKLVNEVVELFLPATRTRALKIHLDYSAEIPSHLLGSRINLYRILLNLMNNAIKFTQQGSITIRVRPTSKKSASDEIFIELSVIDTGKGIPKYKQDVIFARFSQLNSFDSIYEGRGIGLDIVQRLVSMMNGKIEVKSDEGKGSRFTVIVPLKVACVTEEVVS